MTADLISALEAWRAAIGADRVDDDDDARRRAGQATFATPNAGVLAVLRPSSAEQVQACVKIANQFAVPLYPISRGRNWGYGSMAPAEGNCVIVDLRDLDRITDYDDRLGTVTVEPGVTQDALSRFLADNGDRFWIDATGSTPDASMLGNALERGNGYSPYAEHCDHLCGIEAVLGDGSLIRTGFGAFEDAIAVDAYKWGLGPSLDGLFFQSNFAIIVRTTMWLFPRPEQFQAFFFSVKQPEQIADVVNALAPLRLEGVLNSAVHIGNVYRVMCSTEQYPWSQTTVTPLPKEQLADFQRRAGVEAWSGSGGIYGTPGHVRDARRHIKRALKGKVSRLQFLDDRLLAIAGKVSRPYQMVTGIDLGRLLGLLRPVYGMMQGRPSGAVIPSAYWRKRTPPPKDLDPDRDLCGLIWCPVISPPKGESVRKVVSIASETLLAHGFEPSITVTLLTERAIDVVISIGYDREVEGEDERAQTAYRVLLEKVVAEGFYPYRLATLGMPLMDQMKPEVRELLAKLKAAFDPKGILSPGRYVRTADRG